MTGYPESLTDPSYRGQILCLTYPLVGNYGAPAKSEENNLYRFYESSSIHIAGLIVSDYSFEYSHWNAIESLGEWLRRSNVPGIFGIDTRALTKRIREKGAMLGKVEPEGMTTEFYDPNKVNLGVGVYFDDNGKLPLLQCVQAAEKAMMSTPTPRGYLPIDGIVAYDNAVKGLVFGADSEPVTSGRVATVQAVGGTGGLKIGADFLKKLSPNATVLISDPSWENHRALFTNAGFAVESYPYYDAAKRGVNFDAMLADLNAAAAGTIVVLHACCHNPTGYDITAAQWDAVVAICKAGKLTPFLDMAYQGFGEGNFKALFESIELDQLRRGVL